jgi:hypothetical protein
MTELRTWHALVASLPTTSRAARMRLWRGARALGSGVLRDGVYLLPGEEKMRASFQALANDVAGAGGVAHVLDLTAHDELQDAEFLRMFDRTGEYSALMIDIAALRDDLTRTGQPEWRKRGKALRTRLNAVRETDFFPGEPATATETAMQHLERTALEALSPGEPHDQRRAIPRADPAAYRGRRWATRKRPWIDRLASAWLIRRFIDPKARFVWLDGPEDCPADAVGFDYDGAAFTHANERVTFEVLAASFALDADPDLLRFGALVHFLDVGGIPVPEAAGIARIAAGFRESIHDDDELLMQMSSVFDGLLAAYRAETRTARENKPRSD